ncbi:MAG: hypothetical protein LBT78_00075 [Tannerella sp.]|jgi:hypothetical protein|nr:hypothetical protein [Tannerella sp.]
MLEHLHKLPPESVKIFLETRNAESLNIPNELAFYILQVNDASTLLDEHKSVTSCARELQNKWPELSVHTCRKRIYDAINYFNADCTVTAEAWNLYFAEVMMELAGVNRNAGDYNEERLCYERAREYRLAACSSAIDPDRIRFKPQLVSPDIELERMGVKKQGILGAYKKALAIIDSVDVTDAEKQRLITEVETELGIKSTNYEEIGN